MERLSSRHDSGRIIADIGVRRSEMVLTKKQRAELRMKFGGRCAYCGCELPEKGWHADHVEAVYRKLDALLATCLNLFLILRNFVTR